MIELPIGQALCLDSGAVGLTYAILLSSGWTFVASIFLPFGTAIGETGIWVQHGMESCNHQGCTQTHQAHDSVVVSSSLAVHRITRPCGWFKAEV